MPLRLLTFCIIAFPCLAQGQSLQLLKEITIPKAKAVSKDLSGNIYIASEKGDVFKYNDEGERITHYSPTKQGEISLIEAWNPLRVFLFYADFQEYLFLDRFLTPSPLYALDESITGFVNTASPSLDNNIWLVDLTSFSLQKFDINFNQVLINIPLELILNPKDYEINFIKEYQNILFVNDKKTGILVFDNLGNYIRTIKMPGLDYFSFDGNQLCFLKENNIHTIDIYVANPKHKLIKPNVDKDFQFVLLSSNKVFLIAENTMYLYTIRK